MRHPFHLVSPLSLRRVTAIVSLWIAATTNSTAFAQSSAPPCPEAPGILVAGDFDQDGDQDLVLFGVLGDNRTLLGQRQTPYLRRGALGPPTTLWKLVAEPISTGPFLYLPVRTPSGEIQVEVHHFLRGHWEPRRTLVLPTAGRHRRVVSLRLTPAHVDWDLDGHNDVLAAWVEGPEFAESAAFSAVLSPTRKITPRSLPRLFGQPQREGTLVAAVTALPPLPGRAAPTPVTVWTRASTDPLGGFGFQAGDRFGTGRWHPSLPTIDVRRLVHTASGVLFGRFVPGTQARSALMLLTSGHLALAVPQPNPPYLAPGLVFHHVGRRCMLVGLAAVDFDRDGLDEVAMLQSQGARHLADLLILSPGRPRARASSFSLDDGISSTSAFAGALGDFDGDGIADLAITYYRGGNPRRGGLALFTGTGDPISTPPIRRRY